ncbi:MAG: YbhB/YbcL family Raf kinase inhibitor-like protein [Solirubrobacteraceae bacterium]
MPICARGRLLSTLLALALLVAGCGSGGSKSRSTATKTGNASAASPTTRAPASGQPAATATAQTTGSAPAQHIALVDITVSSPAVAEGGALPARYTCHGADISPPLRWGAVPAGTAELVLFISNLERKAPGGGPLIYWAVAGLRPAPGGIAAGAPAAGAVVGRNSLGQDRYSICPSPGGVQHYLVSLFALAHPIAAKPGFDAAALYQSAASVAEHKGLFGFADQPNGR